MDAISQKMWEYGPVAVALLIGLLAGVKIVNRLLDRLAEKDAELERVNNQRADAAINATEAITRISGQIDIILADLKEINQSLAGILGRGIRQ